LAFLDASAFIEKDADDATGDFGGDRGAAARSDIAAGVQQGFATAGSDRFMHGGNFHDRLLVPKGINAAGNSGEDNQPAKENGENFADFTALALPFVYAQGAEIMLRRT
jgi:hypothetical protein